jgi:DNA-3-methyladenine glycosylase
MGHPNPERLIPLAFYQKKDVVELAKELIGCTVHTTFDNAYCVAQITETEAYRGWGDKACHAHMNRRTKRTEIMYAPGGLAYVYLCYGIHHLFNIVTNQEDNADAILIRAAKPISGVDNMLERRKQE